MKRNELENLIGTNSLRDEHFYGFVVNAMNAGRERERGVVIESLNNVEWKGTESEKVIRDSPNKYCKKYYLKISFSP